MLRAIGMALKLAGNPMVATAAFKAALSEYLDVK